MEATHNVISEEKMAIVLQEVTGTAYGDRFYPNISGVARSLNFYPIEPEKPIDGIASIALGLGKHVVEGKPSLRFSPKYPKKLLQLSTPEMAIKETQKTFYALDLKPTSFTPSTDDDVNLIEINVKEAFENGTLTLAGSTFDFENQRISDGYNGTGVPIITFAGILKHKQFPLPDIIKDVLELGQYEMNNPVEIEFAVNLNQPPGKPKIFSMLQIRPIVQNRDIINVDLTEIDKSKFMLYSPSALGNGIFNDLKDVVYLKADAFDPAKTVSIAEELEKINHKFIKQQNQYVLIGPGRWGSSDSWLGVPVKWSQISAAKIIVEAGLDNYKVDPSQGTHFFQNLTSFKVAYITVNEYMNEGFIDYTYLNSIPAVYESEMIRHIKLPTEMQAVIDGHNKQGAITKDGEKII